jgi:hypothetical protein
MPQFFFFCPALDHNSPTSTSQVVVITGMHSIPNLMYPPFQQALLIYLSWVKHCTDTQREWRTRQNHCHLRVSCLAGKTHSYRNKNEDLW